MGWEASVWGSWSGERGWVVSSEGGGGEAVVR